jgi:BASS family bile acid:Na+ symporter
METRSMVASMDARPGPVAGLANFVNRHFLALVLAGYAAAALWPGPGLRLRAVRIGEVAAFGETTRVTPPVLMLALLVGTAGLGVRTAHLRHLGSGSLALAAGLVANLALPLAFIFAINQALRLWHNPDEVQNLLVGLALVASMPVAGSSSAWTQNAEGNVALSLGLVLFSTLLSPLTTPAALYAVGGVTTGAYADRLNELAADGTGGFLAVCVVLPTLAGLAGRAALGEARVTSAGPYLRLFNSLNLLLLSYVNGSASLPESFANPDPDFLAITLVLVLAMCLLGFAAGAGIARVLGAGAPTRVALMFGLGMNNNGTGLVLAALTLADHPRVLLPIIFYNLVQHLVAAAVHSASRPLPAGA